MPEKCGNYAEKLRRGAGLRNRLQHRNAVSHVSQRSTERVQPTANRSPAAVVVVVDVVVVVVAPVGVDSLAALAGQSLVAVVVGVVFCGWQRVRVSVGLRPTLLFCFLLGDLNFIDTCRLSVFAAL